MPPFMPATATRSRSRRTPADPYHGRLTRLRALLAPFETDHILITNPADVAYFTGFLGGESYLLVGPGRPTIISDGRFDEELEPVRALAEVYIRKEGLLDAVRVVARDKRIRRLAVQAEHLPLADFEALAERLGRSNLVPTQLLVQQLRIIKDETEIALMRKATRIQEEALLAILPSLRRGKGVGKTELEVAARLEAEMKARGSSKPGFETIVAARANGSLPHYRPGSTKLAANRPLLIDWGATYRGYQSDMTRTFTLGAWPKKIREIYAIVLEAQQAAAAALAPGRTTREIDTIARDLITRTGYGEAFNHGLGHGLGLTKEPPFLHHLYPDRPLEAGMVATVEPGIYLPGVGGVRIEDLYVIRERGAENLCSLPKDLEWATL